MLNNNNSCLNDEKEILNKLSLNTCSEGYYRIPFSKLVYTSGIEDLIKRCRCWWLISDFGILLNQENKLNKSFLILTIEVNKDKTAILTLKEDSDKKPIYTKELTYTDFPLTKFEFYIIDNVMLLKSEY